MVDLFCYIWSQWITPGCQYEQLVHGRRTTTILQYCRSPFHNDNKRSAQCIQGSRICILTNHGMCTCTEVNSFPRCRLLFWKEDEGCLRIEAIEVEATGYNMQIVHELWLKQQQLLVWTSILMNWGWLSWNCWIATTRKSSKSSTNWGWNSSKNFLFEKEEVEYLCIWGWSNRNCWSAMMRRGKYLTNYGWSSSNHSFDKVEEECWRFFNKKGQIGKELRLKHKKLLFCNKNNNNKNSKNGLSLELLNHRSC